MLQQHLTKLTQELELEQVENKDEQNCFRLPLNPELDLSLKSLDPGIFVFSKIGKCPMEKREDLFIHLMKANFLGQGTGGSVIGLDQEENFLTLSLTLPYDMNYKAFKESIEDFANFIDYWKGELLRHQKEASQGLFS